jgi:hypothetical protein
MEAKEELKYFVGLTLPNDWYMFPSERVTLIGLLQLLKPKRTLEIGHLFGGCTKHLSAYSEEVYTVDINSRVIESSKRFDNVKAFYMDSVLAMKEFALRGLRFDLAIIDADHSEAGAERDVTAVLGLADVIILHDAANPECRRGYAKALANTDAYYDLDFVDGKHSADGPWGGFGLIMTYCKNETYKLVKTLIPNSYFIEQASKGNSSCTK